MRGWERRSQHLSAQNRSGELLVQLRPTIPGDCALLFLSQSHSRSQNTGNGLIAGSGSFGRNAVWSVQPNRDLGLRNVIPSRAPARMCPADVELNRRAVEGPPKGNRSRSGRPNPGAVGHRISRASLSTNRLARNRHSHRRRRHHHFRDRINHQFRLVQMNPVRARRRNHLLHIVANLP